MDDLLIFSYQVAQGLEFLTSKNVSCQICVKYQSKLQKLFRMKATIKIKRLDYFTDDQKACTGCCGDFMWFWMLVLYFCIHSVFTETSQPGMCFWQMGMWQKSVTLDWPVISWMIRTMWSKETWVNKTDPYIKSPNDLLCLTPSSFALQIWKI